MIDIGIIGATGYTGFELLRLLGRHPEARIVWLTSENFAGQRFGDVFAAPGRIGDYSLIKLAQADYKAVDCVFCCLPHAASQAPVAAAHAAGARVVDLSADYRLQDPAEYEKWYAHPHEHPDLLAEAVYGLPELYASRIAQARVVANPGCYPTSVILGLAPLAVAGWLAGTIISDSKSGVSGAGRQPSLKTHFVEANENLSPYNIGRTHRHLPEMEQALAALSGTREGWNLIFSPHLVPISRGMLSTIYVTLPEAMDETTVRDPYEAMFAEQPFVRLLPRGQVASMGHTTNTNYSALGLTFVAGTRTLIVTSSIDNLGKGASGQAVQNMNLMFGCEQTTGLL